MGTNQDARLGESGVILRRFSQKIVPIAGMFPLKNPSCTETLIEYPNR
jgi:hypothetical protein